MNEPIDLQSWVGRKEQTRDQIGSTLVNRIAATFGEATIQDGDDLPPLWHWAFFQDSVPNTALGSDGHPARGGFLPPADDRNRMWAGSRLEFIKPFKVGAYAARFSTIKSIKEKHGRTGSLLFVTVEHEYTQRGETILREEQDIVYREPSPPKLAGTEPMPQSQWQELVEPTPTLLFRYSAVTFNGHRIHYDWPYVTGSEGYPGLVTHGPLIATLNLRAFQRANPHAMVHRYSFRGVRSLICPDAFSVTGLITENGRAKVWAGNEVGVAQMGEIEYQ